MSTYSKVIKNTQPFGKNEYSLAADAFCSAMHTGAVLTPGLDAIKEVMKTFGKSRPLVIHDHHKDSAYPEQPVKDRVIEHFCLYMVAVLGCKEDLIMPMTYYGRATSVSYLKIERTSPLLIATDKLEKNILMQTNRDLDYKSKHIFFAILFSTLLSKALEPLLETAEDVMEIILPHQQGILIGSARRKAEPIENEFDAGIYTVSTASRTKRAKTETLPDPDFRITSKIFSFIRFSEMNADQFNLSRRIEELRRDAQFMNDLDTSFETFSRPLLYQPAELAMRHQIIARTVARVSDLVASREWRDACTLKKNYFKKNVPIWHNIL